MGVESDTQTTEKNMKIQFCNVRRLATVRHARIGEGIKVNHHRLMTKDGTQHFVKDSEMVTVQQEHTAHCTLAA